MHTPRSIAIDAALEAGRIIRGYIGRLDSIDYKGEVDLVTEADHTAEAAILDRLQRAFPDFGVLAEESGVQDSRSGSSSRWIVDPLDGTTNFASGNPHFCVSIALQQDGIVTLGVVYDPMLDELFIAERGAGAWMNGAPLTVSPTTVFLQAVLATGFSYDIERRGDNFGLFMHFTNLTRAVRRAGSAALDLCYVASGRFDGYWEASLQPWDTAAGALMVVEAGGTVTDYAGAHYDIESPGLIASNGNVHADLLAGIQQVAERAGER